MRYIIFGKKDMWDKKSDNGKENKVCFTFWWSPDHNQYVIYRSGKGFAHSFV